MNPIFKVAAAVMTFCCSTLLTAQTWEDFVDVDALLACKCELILDPVCVDLGVGMTFPAPNACVAECLALPVVEGVLNHVRCLVDLRSKYDTQNSNVGAGGFFLNQYPARDRTRDRTSLATDRAFSAPLARASSIWALSAMSSWKRARSSANPSTRASSNAFLAWPHP